jgi:hypothetical protein
VRLAFERAVRTYAERRQYWSRFVELPDLAFDTAAIGRVWAAARDRLLEALGAKQNSPLEHGELSPAAMAAIDEYQRMAAEVLQLSNQLLQQNAAIRHVKEQAAAGNVQALEADLVRLRAVEARREPDHCKSIFCGISAG